MNFRKLNRLTSLYFWIMMAAGGMYLALLFWIMVRTTPGMVMLMIYLADSMKQGYLLTEVLGYRSLLLSVGLWWLSIYWLIKAARSVLVMTMNILKTGKLTHGLETIKETRKKVFFRSNLGEIFTAGLWKPKIYISSNLHKYHSEEEIRAMIAHEKRHVEAKDPLRTTLVRLFGNMTPNLPYKEEIIQYFYTLTEICADRRAEEKMGDKLPVVSALYKRLAMAGEKVTAGINFFNSQSERINILIGRRHLEKRKMFGLGAVILTGMAILTWSVSRLSFYDCAHLVNCLSSFSNAISLH